MLWTPQDGHAEKPFLATAAPVFTLRERINVRAWFSGDFFEYSFFHSLFFTSSLNKTKLFTVQLNPFCCLPLDSLILVLYHSKNEEGSGQSSPRAWI